METWVGCIRPRAIRRGVSDGGATPLRLLGLPKDRHSRRVRLLAFDLDGVHGFTPAGQHLMVIVLVTVDALGVGAGDDQLICSPVILMMWTPDRPS